MIIVSKKEKIFLAGLFIVSLLIRLGVYYMYLSENNNYWQADSQTYHRVAVSIAEGKGICSLPGSPNFYRLPGYPIFIAFFYKLFGPNPQSALWGQVVLGSFIPLLIFLLALVLFSRRRWIAYIASIYSAIQLGLVLYSGFFMSETLFIFLFLLFCIFFFAAVHLWFCDQKEIKTSIHACVCQVDQFMFLPDGITTVPSFEPFYERIHATRHIKECKEIPADNAGLYMLLSGLFLGFASLVRPVGLYLFIVSLIFIVLSRDAWREKIRKSAIFFVMWFIPVAVWLIRNYVLLGHIFFHTLPGGHFLYLSAARVVAQEDNTSYHVARAKLTREVGKRIREQERAQKKQFNEIERCYVHEQLARHYFMTYPWTSIKLWLTDMFRTTFSLYSAELLYLDSGRQDVDYFASTRTLWSLLERYFLPATENPLLKMIIYIEIFLALMLWLGILFGFFYVLWGFFFPPVLWSDLCSWARIIPYTKLFIIIALAGGYARMRLPIEPLLIILAIYGWGMVVFKMAEKK